MAFFSEQGFPDAAQRIRQLVVEQRCDHNYGHVRLSVTLQFVKSEVHPAHHKTIQWQWRKG